MQLQLCYRGDVFVDIIRQLSLQISPHERKNIVNVDRGNILEGAWTAVMRPYFNPLRGVNVRFSGEDGIDSGGLTREFFRLSLGALQTSVLFCGHVNKRFLNMDYKC